MKFLCRVGWHNWSAFAEKYSEVWTKQNSAYDAAVTGIATINYQRHFQDRRCQDCRTIQKREVSA